MQLLLDNIHQYQKDVLRPSYERSALSPGIVHIGVGNFHRAHQAWYLHRLMEMGLAQDWAIIGGGVRHDDNDMRARLLRQDCLTTLIELDPSGVSAEVVGSMIDYIPVESGNRALIARLADARTRIVSLTVTEGGYFIIPGSHSFDVNHPEIKYDIENPSHPKTVFGALVEALRLRRDGGISPFTCLSCDNLQGNGDVLRAAVVSLAKIGDPDLGRWIDENSAFPNSMVDCIVPATGPDEFELVRSFGIEDAAPVTHENFRQWVIEDTFCAGRPEWERVGVTFTSNVHAYETMKLRVLNAGHQVLANVGELLSVESISDCMGHPVISEFFRRVEYDEIAPHVPDVPEMNVVDYIALIERRFSNSKIKDTPRRVAFDGSSRHSGFVVPIIRDALNTGASVSGLALVEALWARMCAGTREDGSIIEPNDPLWSELSTLAQRAKQNPRAWLEQSSFYGDVSGYLEFADSFIFWLNRIWSRGSEETLKFYISGRSFDDK